MKIKLTYTTLTEEPYFPRKYRWQFWKPLMVQAIVTSLHTQEFTLDGSNEIQLDTEHEIFRIMSVSVIEDDKT